MTEITAETITAAQAGDLTASTAVVEVTDPLIGMLAREAAGRIAGSEHSRRADLVEEFESIGRLAVWEHLGAWKGEAKFTTFMYAAIRGAIADGARETVSPGADHMALKLFVRMLKIAGGDAILAETLCTTLPKAGERISKDRANAARLAFEGAKSLDAPSPYDPEASLGDALADTLTEFDVPADLVTSDDLSGAQRKARRALVRAVLDTLSPLRREVLKARVGFEGYADDLDPTDVPEAVSPLVGGLPTQEAVTDAYRKGKAQFAARFPLDTAYPTRVEVAA